MENELDAFEGLDEVLGTNFVSSNAVVETVPDFVPDTENHDIAEDKLYLMNQLKKLDHDTEVVVALLKAELKIGAKTNYHTVFAQLVKARLEIYKEIRELDFAYDATKKAENNGQQKAANVEIKATVPLTSTDLFALANSKKVAEAKKTDSEEVK